MDLLNISIYLNPTAPPKELRLGARSNNEGKDRLSNLLEGRQYLYPGPDRDCRFTLNGHARQVVNLLLLRPDITFFEYVVIGEEYNPIRFRVSRMAPGAHDWQLRPNRDARVPIGSIVETSERLESPIRYGERIFVPEPNTVEGFFALSNMTCLRYNSDISIFVSVFTKPPAEPN